MSGIMNMLVAAKTTIAAATDAFFNRVTLLLNTGSTNGAQNNTFLDSSSNNFTITRNGNTTQGTFTPFSQTGWSNYFPTNNATSQTTLTAAVTAFGTGNFTIELNYYLIAHASGNVGQIYESGTNGIGILVENTNQLRVFQRDGAGTSTTLIASGTGTAITVNAWSHIALVRTGTGTNQLTLYVNGSSVGTGTSSANYTSTTGYINGRYTGANYFPVICYISNLRVSTTNRTITVPTAFYTSDASTTLLTCISNRFVNVVNGNSLTVLSTATVEPSVQAFSPFAPGSSYSTGVVGGSGYFDGTGDYLTVAGSSLLAFGNGEFSLEAVVYPTSLGTNMKIYDARPNTTAGNYPVLQITLSNTVEFLVDSTLLLTGTTAIQKNAWTHVLVSRVSGNLRLFINGVQDGSTVSNSTNFANGTARPAIGSRGSTLANDLYFGYISSIRVLIGSGFTSVTVPTAPPDPTGSALCLQFTNAGIYDAAAKNVLETVGNAQVSTTTTKFGATSMYFDGAGDYLTLPLSGPDFGSGDFTIDFWFYKLSTGGQRLVSARSNNDGITFGVNSSNLLTAFYGDTTVTGTIAGTTTIAINTWYYVALVRASGTTRIYLNGSVEGTPTSWSAKSFTSTAYRIGSSLDSRNEHFNGYMDEVRFTKYARTITTPTDAFPIQ